MPRTWDKTTNGDVVKYAANDGVVVTFDKTVVAVADIRTQSPFAVGDATDLSGDPILNHGDLIANFVNSMKQNGDAIQ
jgi:hypothetical protein